MASDKQEQDSLLENQDSNIVHFSQLSADLFAFYSRPERSDIQFVVDGQTVKANKVGKLV